MTEAITKDKKQILPCAAHLEREDGVNGRYMGAPVKLGREGVEKIIELELNQEEKEAFKKSEAAVRELVSKLSL